MVIIIRACSHCRLKLAAVAFAPSNLKKPDAEIRMLAFRQLELHTMECLARRREQVVWQRLHALLEAGACP
jgi:hypothetical protein